MNNLFYELIRDDAGRRLKYERNAWGMSRRRLARLSNIDSETIEYIENGYVCLMDFNMLLNICKALDISPFSFFKKNLSSSELIEMI